MVKTRFAPLVVMALAIGCTPTDTKREPPVRPVKTTVVVAGDEPHIRSFPGRVDASKRVELAFQVSGVIVELPVKEGQTVKKGDLIARVRPDEFQSRLDALKGQLDKARATLTALRAGDRPEQQRRLEAAVRAAAATMANARTQVDRDRRLLVSRAVSREAFERTDTAYRVARQEHFAAVEARDKGTSARQEDIDAKEAAVRGLEAQVVEANLSLTDTSLRAPYDGVIAKRFVEANQNVRAKEPIVRFQDIDEIEVAVDVPETVMVAELRRAEILSLEAEFAGAPGLSFPVQIREVAQKADAVTQTFRVRVAMKMPPDINLLPGMSATVTVNYRRAAVIDSRILVPLSALATEAGGQQVAFVIADATAARRAVKVGEASGGRVEILDGLAAGDRIAVAGVALLRDGMAVRDLGDDLGGQP